MLRGSFRALFLYDIAEEIPLDALRAILGSEPPGREPAFKHPVPDYVRFAFPPVVETAEPFRLESGENFQVRIKYFDYGIASVEMETPFALDWNELVLRSSNWIAAAELERAAVTALRSRLPRVSGAIEQVFAEPWISEDYSVIHIEDVRDERGQAATADYLLMTHADKLARIVRGEAAPLSATEVREALQSSASYYPTDLLLAGWVAAVIVDTAAGATASLQLLEYANTQLLEYRHYDELLTKVLARVHKTLGKRGGLIRRWRTAREAEKLNRLRLEVIELSERSDNAIKFLSDMFYARAYKIAAARVGVPDYRNLVDSKLRTAGELYESMVNEFHQGRAFILELAVVAILIIDLVMLFRGK